MFYKTEHGDSAHTTASCGHIIGHAVYPLSASDSLPLCKDCGGLGAGAVAGGVGTIVSGEYEAGSPEYENAVANLDEHVVMMPDGFCAQVSGGLGEDYQTALFGAQKVTIPKGCVVDAGQIVDRQVYELEQQIAAIESTYDAMRARDRQWQLRPIGEQPHYLEEAQQEALKLKEQLSARKDHLARLRQQVEDRSREQEEYERRQAILAKEVSAEQEKRDKDPDGTAAEQAKKGRRFGLDFGIARNKLKGALGLGEKVAASGKEVSDKGRSTRPNRAPAPSINQYTRQNRACAKTMREAARSKLARRKQKEASLRKELRTKMQTKMYRSDRARTEFLKDEYGAKMQIASDGLGGLIGTHKRDLQHITKTSIRERRRHLTSNQDNIEREIVQHYFPHLPKDFQNLDAVWDTMSEKERQAFIALASETVARTGGIGLLGENALRDIANAEADRKGRARPNLQLPPNRWSEVPPEQLRRWSPWMQVVYEAHRKMSTARECAQAEDFAKRQQKSLPRR